MVKQDTKTAVSDNGSGLSSAIVAKGKPVTVSAKFTGGVTPYRYKYAYKKDGGSWVEIKQPKHNNALYSTDDNFSFTLPSQAGNYTVKVVCRDGVGKTKSKDFKISVYEINSYEKEVVRLVNNIRKEYGLGTLTINTDLSMAARLKAEDMHDNRYFDHTSPTYGSPFDMMEQFDITYFTAGENIAWGQSTPEWVVNSWMNSPGHRANILNASYTQIGMGYVSDGNYWSQMFIG